MRRDLIIALSVLVLGGGLFVWATFGDPAGSSALPATSPKNRETPPTSPKLPKSKLRPTGLGAMRPAPEPIPWSEVPEQVQAVAAAPIGAALLRYAAEHPQEGYEVLPIDCTQAPCIVPVRTPPGRQGADPLVKALLEGVELEADDTVGRIVPVTIDGLPGTGIAILPKAGPAMGKLSRAATGRALRSGGRAEESEAGTGGAP